MLYTWEELLEATGGMLAPKKSYWYLVDMVYCNGKWQYWSKEDCPGELFLLHNTDSALLGPLIKDLLGVLECLFKKA
jgi:hypothetical protein